jgi:hypothetical protein
MMSLHAVVVAVDTVRANGETRQLASLQQISRLFFFFMQGDATQAGQTLQQFTV